MEKSKASTEGMAHTQGPTGSRYPTRPDPKIENDWVPSNEISF